MATVDEDGLHYVETPDESLDDEGVAAGDALGGDELETLRDEYVDAFNARDLDAVLALTTDDVDVPDLHGEGAGALAEELESIWERSPGALLTRGFLDSSPCAMAWLPDGDGCWQRAAMFCFDAADGLLSVVSIVDAADALERAEAEDPEGETLPEGEDWKEWEEGEATEPTSRQRTRP